MRKIQMVDILSQYKKIEDEISSGMQAVFDKTAFIGGPDVKALASELEDWLNVKHVIPCGNGTDALQIALMALDLNEGDEVITTPFTFVATAEVIALLKLKPVFVDVEPDSFNLSIDAVKAAVTSRTKAVIPVHLFGQSLNMAPLMDWAKENKIAVIEDNAQSIGAEYTFPDGRKQYTGTIGDIGTTSFYPTKNLGAYGDGGAVMSNSDHLAHRMRLIANHGSDRKYYYDEIGVNSRLDTLQAVILRAKLKRLHAYNKARQEAADRYDKLLRDIPEITLPYRVPYSTHVFHQYTIRVHSQRDELKEHLAMHEIPSMIYYPVPLHISKAYAKFGYQRGDFPISEKLSEEVLSLPMHTELDEEQQTFITDTIRNFFKRS